MSDVQDSLFNATVTPHDYDSASYHAHLIEQYKLYVEMADRVSARRQAANAFFVSINSAILALVGYANILNAPQHTNRGYVLVPIAGIVLCVLWAAMIGSYKNLNSVKFKVVHELEKRLPAKLYDFEWTMAGKGKSATKYLPLTHVEVFVPWVFVLLHFVVILMIL